MADWKSPMRADPSEWLVLNASAPIRYRLLTELHSMTVADPNVARLQKEVLGWKAAKQELWGKILWCANMGRRRC